MQVYDTVVVGPGIAAGFASMMLSCTVVWSGFEQAGRSERGGACKAERKLGRERCKHTYVDTLPDSSGGQPQQQKPLSR